MTAPKPNRYFTSSAGMGASRLCLSCEFAPACTVIRAPASRAKPQASQDTPRPSAALLAEVLVEVAEHRRAALEPPLVVLVGRRDALHQVRDAGRLLAAELA